MNRSYTTKEYLDLVKKIKSRVEGARISTDIIIGFPGEDEAAFDRSVEVYREADFEIGYLNKYSPRKGTVSAKTMKDEISIEEKKRRWWVLEELINKK